MIRVATHGSRSGALPASLTRPSMANGTVVPSTIPTAIANSPHRTTAVREESPR